jgi:hypothetical protein
MVKRGTDFPLGKAERLAPLEKIPFWARAGS